MIRYIVTTAFTLFLIGSAIPPADAATINVDDVRSAVETWVRYETADARPNARVAAIQPWPASGAATAYIAHLEGGGFCICGADSRVLPVYFYSSRGAFDADREDFAYILWEIGARKTYLEDEGSRLTASSTLFDQSLSDREAYWQQLIAGTPPPRSEGGGAEAAPNTLVLNLTTQWNQHSPYNDYCPNLTPGEDERVYVGCVATATAQIMKYWNWPTTGVSNASQDYNFRWRTDLDQTPLPTNPRPDLDGTYWTWYAGRLEWTAAGGGQLGMTGYWDHSIYLEARKLAETDTLFIAALDTLWNRMPQDATPNTVNFAAATYNWGIMPDQATDPTDAGDLEVAKLSYHASVACQMNWGVRVSTSGLDAAISAIEDHFRYDLDAFRSPVSSNAFIEDVQWMRPALIEGCRLTGGCHAWVVMGYNLGIAPDHQFYVNLGGSGSGDGWYTLDSMPFNIYQYQGTRVAPANVKFVGAADAGDGTPDDPYIDIDEAKAEAPDHSILVFKAGSTNTFAGTSLRLDRPMTLKGHNVRIE
jgi:hypothetical protein